jgi:Acetyltransferase (GNAT) domain
MTADAALVAPDSAEWAAALQHTRHDMYHEPDYVRLDAKLYGGEPIAFHYPDGDRRFLLPLIVRAVPDSGRRDAISPYGYPGPISDADLADTAFFAAAGAALRRTLRDHGIVTAFVRMHPLLPAPLATLGEFGVMVRHGETVSMDLRITEDQMWQQTRSDHRNHINRARRAGTKVIFDDWSRLGEWVRVYHDNMRRVGATSYYFFTSDHLAALHERVGDRMHLALAIEGDEVVGGNTFFEYDGICTGYVSSTRRAKNRYADEMLYDEVRRWCRQRGDRIFHLGGGRGGSNDSLFSYKAGFSPCRHPFHTWRVIADPEAYAQLMRDRRPEADPADLTGSFPPYR